MLVIHQLIPHHHLDYLSAEISSHYEYDNSNSHHSGDEHQHDSSVDNEQDNPTKSEHDHDFPLHFHGSATGNFNFTQQSQSKLSKQIQQIFIIILQGTVFRDLYRPPDIKYVYGNLPFLKTSLYQLGAITLRGPPIV